MLIYEIPGWKTLSLSTVVFDLNGTLAVDGTVVSGASERVVRLKQHGITCYLLTADTRGRAQQTADRIGLELYRLRPGSEFPQKAAFVRHLGAHTVAAIGNGANDAEMLHTAAVGIAVLQEEGLAAITLQAADLIVPDVNAALDLLLKPQRLIATLRR